ncbi:MAG: hypothetical protein QXT73_01300 [Candidatus Methanomethylicaceae archaeon]
MSYLTLDVATYYTGYAIFTTPPQVFLTHLGLLKGKKYLEWDTRGMHIASCCMDLVKRHNIGAVLMEFPSFQGGVRGEIAAREGVTIKLAWLCGIIEGRLSLPVTKVTFNQWNGQVPKDVTCKRFTEIFKLDVDPRSIQNNYVDAAMMGVWFFRRQGIEPRPSKHIIIRHY